MKIASLLYHDVVDREDWDSSGFRGGDANIYKLSRTQFQQHLTAIDGVPAKFRMLAHLDMARRGSHGVLLTFDDGGIAAHLWTADLLEQHGWFGHFFITTGQIGKPGFMSGPQIADLHRRGHAIGSHSASHPQRMAHLEAVMIRREWDVSLARLTDILGAAVDLASVPGGFYSRQVATEAAASGVRVLFNSEPAARPSRVGNCLVVGRFSLMRSSAPTKAAQFAAFNFSLVCREYLFWNTKKAVKIMGGEAWLRFRKRVLASH